jgi:hypothetical protein
MHSKTPLLLLVEEEASGGIFKGAEFDTETKVVYDDKHRLLEDNTKRFIEEWLAYSKVKWLLDQVAEGYSGFFLNPNLFKPRIIVIEEKSTRQNDIDSTPIQDWLIKTKLLARNNRPANTFLILLCHNPDSIENTAYIAGIDFAMNQTCLASTQFDPHYKALLENLINYARLRWLESKDSSSARKLVFILAFVIIPIFLGFFQELGKDLYCLFLHLPYLSLVCAFATALLFLVILSLFRRSVF